MEIFKDYGLFLNFVLQSFGFGCLGFVTGKLMYKENLAT
jgi:hypothetical protein